MQTMADMDRVQTLPKNLLAIIDMDFPPIHVIEEAGQLCVINIGGYRVPVRAARDTFYTGAEFEQYRAAVLAKPLP
jgi:hypothetical protein